MNRKNHKDVKYFIGPEVEHTPAFSKKTLFVVGKQPVEQIKQLAKEHKIPHIFMGANHSFDASDSDVYWDQTITSLLDSGLWVTLDYQAHEHSSVLKMLNAGVWQCRLFVPLLGVRIPNVQSSSPNLTVKIDDVDFNSSNPGVWCFHFREITDSNRFTSWDEYTGDQILSINNAEKTHVEPLVVSEPAPPVTAEIIQPLVSDTLSVITESETIVEELNQQDVGIDTTPNTVHNEETTETTETPATPDAAAVAYADSTVQKKKDKKK